MLKTAVAIRHVPLEDLGFFEAPLRAAGYAIRYLDTGQDDLRTLDPVRTPLVVVLGGPMGVYENERHPFLDEGLRLLRHRLAADRPTLGICLGAQLIAASLGARVYPGPTKEIGFGSVELSNAGRASPLAIAADQPVLHWHGDTFDLPDEATLLASTPAYPNQAFAFGPNVLALQFHLEAGGDIASWLSGHAAELRSSGIEPEPIRHDAALHAAGLRDTAERVLAAWLRLLRK